VIALGKDITEVVLGDRVIFGKFDGVELDAKYAEENCVILNEEQIKAIYV
jgi:co-chaperonin GroES (HSP10)